MTEIAPQIGVSHETVRHYPTRYPAEWWGGFTEACDEMERDLVPLALRRQRELLSDDGADPEQWRRTAADVRSEHSRALDRAVRSEALVVKVVTEEVSRVMDHFSSVLGRLLPAELRDRVLNELDADLADVDSAE